MDSLAHTNGDNPLLIPEIAALVIGNLDMVVDILNCALVNRAWAREAMRILYEGSLTDMQFRTPNIEHLDSLFMQSRDLFAENMRLVKHLLLSPKKPSPEDPDYPATRLRCLEKFRAVHQSQDMELIFRTCGRGPSSVTIPFEIPQDWPVSHNAAFRFPTTAEFVAIDISFCKCLYESMLDSLKEPSVETLNLKALTIYKQDVHQEIQWLLSVLSASKLRFFHFSEGLQLTESNYFRDNYRSPEQDASLNQLLPYLQTQVNLEAISFMDAYCDRDQTPQIPEGSWPNLKALYLRGRSREWVEHLGRWDKLQMLKLDWIPPSQADLTINRISKCRSLKIIELVFVRLDSHRKLLEIAAACPLLKSLKVYCPFSHPLQRQNREIGDQRLFLDLLHVLPNIEILELDIDFVMNESCLQALATLCPRLTYTHLPNAQLCLQPCFLHAIPSVYNLQFMIVECVSFERQDDMSEDLAHAITAEWHRIFPQLQPNPCGIDYFVTHQWVGDDGYDRDSFDVGNFICEFIDRHDDRSEQSELYAKLWNDFGFLEDPGNAPFAFAQLWQMKNEKEIIGWPVIPLSAFNNPMAYSTSLKPGSQYHRWIHL